MLIDKELELLHKEFVSMGNMVYETLRIATIAVINGESDHVREIIEKDEIIDGRENTIDNHCIKLWATQAPVAEDLRFIFSIIRSTNELERLGDHAKDIGRSVKRALQHGELHLVKAITDSCQTVLDQLDSALQAYQKKDSEKARKIREESKASKSSFNQLNEEITSLLNEKRYPKGMLVETLVMGQHLRRIHALIGNICKNTVYFLEGEVMKHKGREHPLTDA